MRRRAKERTIYATLTAVSWLIILPLLAIIYTIAVRGAPALSWEFLTQMPAKRMMEGGIMPAIVGTIYLVSGTVVIALPLGVMGAIYLTEYARQGPLLRLIRLAIVNLAGVPSVVYGLFGLGVFVQLLRFGYSLAAGSCTLALLVLPLVITASEEALRAVPQALREGSLALGATKWQTVRRIVLPNALPGILTGAILAIGRAAGETAPILFTGAAFYLGHLPRSVFDKFMALPYHLYIMATQVPGAPPRIQWGTALVLLVLVLGMNLAAILVRARLRRARRW